MYFFKSQELSNQVEEIKDSMWYMFHGGDINDSDDFYTILHEHIDNAVIYNKDCEDLLKGNMDYCFEEHDLYARPENINQAAYACLYDALMDEDVFDLWNEMEEVLNK